jgi:hypothetical protein
MALQEGEFGVSRKDAKGGRKDAKNCREYRGRATTKVTKTTKNVGIEIATMHSD